MSGFAEENRAGQLPASDVQRVCLDGPPLDGHRGLVTP